MWHFAESRQAGFPTRRGGFPATCEARIGGFGACSSVSPTASRYTGMRAMQSAADANKVLVEIKTDGKPLRFCRPVQAVVADGDRRAASELDV